EAEREGDPRACRSLAAASRRGGGIRLAPSPGRGAGGLDMGAKWADIAFVPSPELAAEIVAAWQWRFPGPWKPFLCSMVGGIFLEDESGVYWLESGTAMVERIASDVAEFESMVRSEPDHVDEWFLPHVVEGLCDAGKRPGPGQCYAFLTLPVFVEGKYETD